MIVPTGIGCTIGGYAGDALPSARLLAAASGCLITHPNVMNGASLYWNDPRMHYVEGWAINQLICRNICLSPSRQQHVGLLFDSGLELELKYRNLQVADACRASLGLKIGPVVDTDQKLEIKLETNHSGVSWGSIGNPDTLIRAGERLLEAGVTAIAIVTRFPEDIGNEATNLYREGKGIDTLAGTEAVISHLLSSHLRVPCAHAPALNPLPLIPILDPRAAGEELGYTFLTCVLVGLSRAPNLIWVNEIRSDYKNSGSFCITGSSIGAVIVPANSLGSEAVLASVERGIPIITVHDNSCILNVGSYDLDVKTLNTKNYAEAAGLVLALREGIAFESLCRPINQLNYL
uniref:DUF3326 domain-containing protein n=1 Tax=Paulinella chromatophora TaxID=39717 RepID=B1X3Y9_PAUCH|nr:hypothetical protein PCC_0208 [Paulinella chromatophora]ACB42658.1 hypothetical protein PCC_0208 [Paulinella chromatophora]|eukprot:gb/GEZN01009729.1/.p1 GENE.gb/GEZN01009729.1/~~gb/GEZN01009729.1/.p1  ORF type:complete len:348 (+),score=-24.16 gb/GEZN01009729.1/:177-1220(+)